jgi:hypothetical protein
MLRSEKNIAIRRNLREEKRAMKHGSLDEEQRAHKSRARSHGDGGESWLPVPKASDLVDTDFQIFYTRRVLKR